MQFQLPINTAGRLTSEEQFENIVLKTSDRRRRGPFQGRRPRDDPRCGGAHRRQRHRAGREELRRQQLSRRRTVAPRWPSSSCPAPTRSTRPQRFARRWRSSKRAFRKASIIAFTTTRRCSSKSRFTSVIHTLIEAFILVFIVVLVFLQNWRATIIPMVAVPVSLIGTFAVMAMLGFSLNNLSLFGLVLAIGIVVDDAIVVVENVERWLAEGMSPRDASRKAMEEVTGPVIAIALVLCAVFVPTAFMAGISGQFYKQFALTIAASTIISAFNSLTLSPALAALLLKPHGHGEHGHVQQEALPRAGIAIIGGLIAYFFLLAPIGHLVGIEVGGHGHGVPKQQPTRAPQLCGHCGPACLSSVQSSDGSPASSSIDCSAHFSARSIGSSTSRSMSTAGWSPDCCASAPSRCSSMPA